MLMILATRKKSKNSSYSHSYWLLEDLDNGKARTVVDKWKVSKYKIDFPIKLVATETADQTACIGLICEDCEPDDLILKANPKDYLWASGGKRTRKSECADVHQKDPAHILNAQPRVNLKADEEAALQRAAGEPVVGSLRARALELGKRSLDVKTSVLLKLQRLVYYIAMHDRPFSDINHLRNLVVSCDVPELSLSTADGGVLADPAANYTSLQSQHALLQSQADVVREELTKKLHASPSVSLTIDESITNDSLPHLILYAHFLDEGTSSTRLLGEIPMTMDREALTAWCKRVAPGDVWRCPEVHYTL